MLNFGKKRKNYSSSARYSSLPVHRSGLAYSRLAKNRSVFFKSLLAKILSILIFAGFIYVLFFSSIFKVSKIMVSGNVTVSTDEVRSIASEITNKKVLKIFNNNLILVKNEDVERTIQEKFNSIDSISVVKRFPQTLAISIIEKPADILWCNRIKVEKVPSLEKIADNNPESAIEENLPQEASQCYLSDEANIIYTKVQSDMAAGNIKIFRDDLINIGDKTADDTVKNFIRGLAKNFNSKTGLEYSYLYLPPISSRELHLTTKDGWKIFFDLNRSVDGQLDVLNSVWRESIPENYKKDNNIEYIDLRVQERVSWKPKNEIQK